MRNQSYHETLTVTHVEIPIFMNDKAEVNVALKTKEKRRVQIPISHIK